MAAETPKMSVEDNATGIAPGKMEKSASTRVPFFDKLPLELREKIYFLAYVADGDKVVKITSVMEIIQRERSNRRSATTSQPISTNSSFTTGTCPLLAMMVNRRFFEEASATWLRSIIIQGENTLQTQFTKYCVQSQNFRDALTSVNTAWPDGFGYITCRETFEDMMLSCKGLRLLQIRVPERAFKKVAKISCVHDLTSSDFQSLEPVQHILKSMSLQRVEAIAETSKEASTESEHKKWRVNVKALEDYINRQIEARQAMREQYAHSSASDTNSEKVIPPTKPAQTHSSPWSSESAIAQKMLDNSKDKFRIGAAQKQPQVVGREALEEKVARMEEEMKVLKERLDAITGFKAA